MGQHDGPAFNKWTEQQENSPDCRWNQQKLKVAASGFKNLVVVFCIFAACLFCSVYKGGVILVFINMCILM